jgi:hypothetical protein
MTLSEFNRLDETAKANAVWDGKFVSSKVVDDVFIQLYELNGLKVEVYYDPIRNQIIQMQPIDC